MSIFDFEKSLVHNDETIGNSDYFSELLQQPRSSHKRNSAKDVTVSNIFSKRQCWSFSSFKNVSFINTKLSNFSFQSCYLDGCSFINDKKRKWLDTVYYTNSFVKDTTFEKIDFTNVDFSNAIFQNCTFYSVSFRSCNFMHSKFINCSFRFVSMRYSNFEYSMFINPSVSSSVLSFNQSPYIIGGIEMVKNGKYIRLNQKGVFMKANEYGNYFQDFINYYLEKNEFFPLVNLYMNLKEVKKAKEVASMGFKKAIMLNNHELAFSFARLINYYGFLSFDEKNSLLEFANQSLTQQENNDYLKERFFSIQNIEEELLYRPSQGSMLVAIFKTNLLEGDERLNDVLKDIDEFGEGCSDENGYHVLKVSHNSPFEIVCLIVGLIGSVASISSVIDTVIKKIKERKAKKDSRNNEVDNVAISGANVTITYSDGKVIRIEKKIN
ncbi:MAG: pentapeptide repeat-containing protein [Bacilli bacterium]|nr:pentapeptide repeat-containing protein [Bacilli bacterium]